jgi:O-antigen ligase
MSLPSRLRRLLGALEPWLDRLGALAMVVVVGVVAGLQLISPNKRVLSVITALLMFGLTWRLDIVTGLGVMILALPFPRATVIFNTNLILVLLMLVIWLLRVTMRQTPPPHRSPIDIPLLTLFISYTVSFYNVEGPNLQFALARFQMMTATWFLFYMIASVPQTRRDFEHLLGFQAASILLVCLLGVYEMTHPGHTLIPGWIEFTNTSSPDAVAFGIRVGSAFYDYELLCEYCALQSLLVLFLFLRADSLLLRTAYGALLALVVFIMFTTVTRGGLVSLGVGVLYLLWMTRRRLTVVGLSIAAGVATAGLVGMNWFVVTFTRTGNLFERLVGSKMVGLLPDNRATVWPAAWNRIFEHPFLGHGPYYSPLAGARIYNWPHSVYLYVGNNVGFIGFAFYAWLLWVLFRHTRPHTDDLRHRDPLQAFMLIARAQMAVFLVDESKIEYLRNDIYAFQIWLMFGMMAAAYRLVSAGAESPAPAAAPRPTPPVRRTALAPTGHSSTR